MKGKGRSILAMLLLMSLILGNCMQVTAADTIIDIVGQENNSTASVTVSGNVSVQQMNLNGLKTPDGQDASLTVTYTNNVSYSSKKHVESNAKESKKTSSDINVSLSGNILSYGEPSYAYRNNKNVDIKGNRGAYFYLQYKNNKGKSTTEKKFLSDLNKSLKKTENRLAFTVSPRDLSDAELTVKTNKKSTKIKKVILKDNSKNIKIPKRQYKYTFNENGYYVINFSGNYTGTYSNDPSYAAYTVTFETNGGSSIADQKVKKGGCVVRPSDPTMEGYSFVNWYKENSLENEFDFSTVIEGNITLYAGWIKDADGDHVAAWVEEALGSSDSEKDSDGDGIDDYTEIYLIGSDPTVYDSYQDKDGDGLSNYDEIITYNTDASLADTDGDGLSDYEEIYIYETDPLDKDTDGDKLSDGDEVRFGSDPKTADKIEDVTQSLDIEESITEDNDALPSVSGNISSIMSEHVSVKEDNSEKITNNRAIIGKAIELSSDLSDELTLGFELKRDVEYPEIMQYSDEDGWTSLDAEENDGIISAKVNGSGIYCVMDIESLLNMLDVDVDSYYKEITGEDDETELDISSSEDEVDEDSSRSENSRTVSSDDANGNDAEGKAEISDESKKIIDEFENAETKLDVQSESKGQADIVFVVDTTGSMGGCISNVADNIIAFTKKLSTEYSVNVNYSLISYKDITCDGTDSTEVVKNGSSNWYTNPADYMKTIADLRVYGGGDTPETAIDGLEKARNLDFRTASKKFVILVTDAGYKTNNNYGIESMDDEIKLMEKSGIIVSVIAPNYQKDGYQDLFEKTKGVFADVYGDFSEELMKLIDLIGTEVSGNWILLSDLQYVNLKNPLAEGSGDTDGDGIDDIDELGTSMEYNLNSYIKKDLEKKGVPEELIEKYFKTSDGNKVKVYTYKSNPVLKDTDFDGIGDKEDENPKYNIFTGSMHGFYDINTASYTMDFREFFDSSSEFSPALSKTSLIMANNIYEGSSYKYFAKEKIDNIRDLLEKHGFENVVDYKLDTDFTDDDISEVAIGYHDVEYNGRNLRIIAAVIRGTNGTVKEWSSNFDMGDPSDYDEEAWDDHSMHRGFYVTEERIRSYLNDYTSGMEDDHSLVYWVTGHSRGAALANILSAELINDGNNVFAYTFATPSTTISRSKTDSKYDSIFNFANTGDLVTGVPLEQWSFGRFGKTIELNISEKELENRWCKWTDQTSYDAMNAHLLEVALNRIDSDCCGSWAELREEAGAQDINDEQYGWLDSRLLRYCTVEERKLLGAHLGWKMYPSTAFVFQILADYISNDGNKNSVKLIPELWNSRFTPVIALLLKDAVSNRDELPGVADPIKIMGDGHAPATYYVLTDYYARNYR
ncbi:MAG: InlB B-repeat-containing protein [Lachnospiraceae bacterium]|nr:InlB B-repeat-containing protein [Lachnospiraceae bacterium]